VAFLLVAQHEKTAIPFVALGAIYISHSSTRHVHDFMKSQLYTYLGSAWYCLLSCLYPAFIGHSSTRHVHDFMKSQLYTYLGCTWYCLYPAFFLPLSVTVQRGMYMIWWKASCTLTLVALGTAFILPLLVTVQ